MVLDVVRIQDAAVDRGAGWEVDQSMHTDDHLVARGEDARRVLDEPPLDNAQGCAWKLHGCRAGDLDMCTGPHGYQHEGCIADIRKKKLLDRVKHLPVDGVSALRS